MDLAAAFLLGSPCRLLVTLKESVRLLSEAAVPVRYRGQRGSSGGRSLQSLNVLSPGLCQEQSINPLLWVRSPVSECGHVSLRHGFKRTLPGLHSPHCHCAPTATARCLAPSVSFVLDF